MTSNEQKRNEWINQISKKLTSLSNIFEEDTVYAQEGEADDSDDDEC